MNCQSYQSLSQAEQIDFIGKLVVAVQTRETGFIAAKMVIEAAEIAGVFKHVKVGYSVFDDNHEVYNAEAQTFSS